MLAHGHLGVHQDSQGHFCKAALLHLPELCHGAWVIPPWRQDLCFPLLKFMGLTLKQQNVRLTGTSLFPKKRWTEYIEC